MWVKETRCEQVIGNAWKENMNPRLDEKMQLAGVRLNQWHRTMFKEMRNKIDMLQREIQHLQMLAPNDESIDKARHKGRAEFALEKEETFWQQRSRSVN